MTKRNFVDHTTMHEMNLALILDTLRLQAPISRAGLAAQTGLNKATVSTMVKNLLRGGLIEELGINPNNGDVGRPAINLALNPDAGYIMGVEIGVDFISVIVTNFAIEIVARRYKSTQDMHSQEDILACAIDLMKESYRQVATRKRPIFGLSVGVPGLVDMAAGTLLFAPNLNWRDIPLRDLLAREFDLPIYIANEANMAAFGESYFGAGRHCDSLVYVSSGVGLGGGIVLDNHLITGAAGFAGEIGHMTVKPDGPRCNCGNVGCWETLATQRALHRFIREQIASGAPTLLNAESSGEIDQISVGAIVQAAHKGDTVAIAALEEVGKWLGVGIANLINAINPHCVVFGGPLSLAHEFVLPALKAEVARRSLSWAQENVEIVAAAHAADATVMGGTAIVHQAVINHPMTWITKTA